MREVNKMDFMSFVCDYALIDLMTLCYRVNHISATAFATYEDINEDCFRINVFPYGKFIPSHVVLKVQDAVNSYLFQD